MNDKLQEKILEFIREYHQQHKWAPSVREIAVGIGLKSPATVQRHLGILQARGRVIYQGKRRIRVVD